MTWLSQVARTLAKSPFGLLMNAACASEVAAAVVVHAANDGAAMHPAGGKRQQFANLDAGGARGDGLDFPANVGRRSGLQVEHVLRGRPPLQVQQNHTLGPRRTCLSRARLHNAGNRRIAPKRTQKRPTQER